MGFFNLNGQKQISLVTCTVVQWIDVFTRPVYADIILDGVKHLQKYSGLQVYGWGIMTNRAQLICSSRKATDLEETIREFKKHTSGNIISAMENDENEPRKTWMLYLLKQIGGITLWQTAPDTEEIRSRDMFLQKLNLIHFSPVKAGWVNNPADYRYSSARDFDGAKGMLELSSYD